MGVPALIEPEGNGENDADDDGVEVRVVDGAGAELAGGPD